MTKTSFWHWFWRFALTVLVIAAAYLTETDKTSEPKKTSRRLDDIKLSAELSREQVVGLWGPPDLMRGSGMDYRAYSLENGQELWFVWCLEPPYFAEHTVLHSPTTGLCERLFPNSRRLDKIKLSHELTRAQVLALWGAPDFFSPYWNPYECYVLDGGQVLDLRYHPDRPYRLVAARLFSSSGEHKELFPKVKELMSP